jgi:hypothetical protein
MSGFHKAVAGGSKKGVSTQRHVRWYRQESGHCQELITIRLEPLTERGDFTASLEQSSAASLLPFRRQYLPLPITMQRTSAQS